MKELSPEFINGAFILGSAIVGALITGIFCWIQAAKNRSRSELRIFASRPTRLIEVDSSISDLVEISVGGEIVPSIYTLDTRIANTGTEPINDGTVKIKFAGQVKVLAIDLENLPAGANDDFQVRQINQQYKEYSVHFKFVNPGEELTVKSLLNANPEKVSVIFRQLGVHSLIRTDYDPLRAEMFEKALFEIIRHNWILHPYFMLVFPQYKNYLSNLKEN